MMRPGFVIAAGFLIVFAAAEASRLPRTSTHLDKHRTRQREIRGYKPEYISTAIGFGKREGSPTNGYGLSRLSDRKKILLSLLENFSGGLPFESLIEQRETNIGLPFANGEDDRQSVPAAILRLSPEQRLLL